jgi:nitrate reductase gamma subunit
MTTLVYLLGYLGVLGFAVTSIMKIMKYVKSTPLHVRWELYPVPHEGERAKHGGSYLEEFEWWKEKRHIDHLGDLKALIMEVFFLEATFHHNKPLWIRTYPFHFGLYMLMGGAILLFLMAIIRLATGDQNAFFGFLYWVLNLMAVVGMLGLVGGGIGLIQRRLTDKGLKMVSTPEHFFDIGAFVLFGLTGLAVWFSNGGLNGTFSKIAGDYVYGLLTFNTSLALTGGFCLHMIIGVVLMLIIPLTFMSHILLKYFFYHDVRWEDVATPESKKNQDAILKGLQFHLTWKAPHLNPEGKSMTWVEMATSGYECQKPKTEEDK